MQTGVFFSSLSIRVSSRISTFRVQTGRYSTLALQTPSISPWFIFGFTDGEGCFNISIQKNPNGKWYANGKSKVSFVNNSYSNPFNDKLSKNNFLQWFSGITDSEGSFMIGITNKGTSCSFRFEIGLHIDDSKMLHFIQKHLELGGVSIRGDSAFFGV